MQPNGIPSAVAVAMDYAIGLLISEKKIAQVSLVFTLEIIQSIKDQRCDISNNLQYIIEFCILTLWLRISNIRSIYVYV